MSRLRRLLCLLVALSLLPGWVELAENVEHVLYDGHLAHDTQDHDAAHAAHDDQEHGCTALAHACACHASVPAVLPGAPSLALAWSVVTGHDRADGTPSVGPTRATSPPTRPPIG